MILILDPQFKLILLEKELDKEAIAAIIKNIKRLRVLAVSFGNRAARV